LFGAIFRSIRRFSLNDLNIPQEQEELGHNQDRSNKSSSAKIQFDGDPNDEHTSNQEQHCCNDRVHSFNFKDLHIKYVEDQHDNVDNDTNGVKRWAEAESAIAIAGMCAIPPIAIENRWNDEAEHDLQNFDDSSIGAEVIGVDVRHDCYWALRFIEQFESSK